MDYQSLGRRIRRARKERNMTQAAVARKARVSLPFYGHIERGTRKASVDTLFRIAEALGASLDWLLGGSRAQGQPGNSLQSAVARLEDDVRALREIAAGKGEGRERGLPL